MHLSNFWDGQSRHGDGRVRCVRRVGLLAHRLRGLVVGR